MSCNSFPDNPVSYHLEFSPAGEWRFNAAAECQGLLQRMSLVMGLDAPKETDSPLIFFTRCDPSCNHCRNAVNGLSHTLQPNLRVDGFQALPLPFMRLWIHPETPGILCQSLYWDSVISDIARIKGALNPVYLALVKEGGFPIHGAFIHSKNRGVIFAGHGGVGKTTTCSRLTKPFFPLSDDETVIVRKGGSFFAHPMPTWSSYRNDQPEKTTRVRERIPLNAIFFLKQASENRVSPMGAGEAAVRLYQSSSETLATYPIFSKHPWEAPPNKKVFDTACSIAKAIPAYTLFLSLTGEFQNEVERALDEISEGEACDR